MKVWRVHRLATLIAICLFLSSGPLVRPVRAAPDHDTYIVQRGDTLFSIARRYGTTVETLQRLNGLPNPHQIRAGQVLTVPDWSGGQAPAAPQPQPDALPSSPGIAGLGSCTYVVQRGDYLYKIARKFGISPLQLARANGLSGASILAPGQVLRVPSHQCGIANPSHALPLPLPRSLLLPTPIPPTPGLQPEPASPPVPAPAQPTPPTAVAPQSDNGGRVKIAEPTPTPTPPIRPEVYD